MLKKSLAALVALGLAAGAQANDYEVGGYIQGNIGATKAGKPDSLKNDDFFNHVSRASGKTGHKVAVGLQLNPYVALEGQYVDLGKHKYKVFADEARGKTELETKGFGASVVGTYPANEDLTLFAKAGAQLLKTKVSARLANDEIEAKASGSARKWSPSFGLGASYEVVDNLELVGEFEHYRKIAKEKGYNVNFASTGLRYKF